MIILDTTTKSLELLLSGAITTNQLVYNASWVDVSTTTFGISGDGSSDGLTNSTTAVTPVAAPSSGAFRQVKFLSVYNADTVAAILTVRINDNGTFRNICKTTLAVGDTLFFHA